MSGKGSKPRPYSVTQQEYDNRWDAIFGKDKNDNTGTSKDEFYDVLSTEECVLDSDIEKNISV